MVPLSRAYLTPTSECMFVFGYAEADSSLHIVFRKPYMRTYVFENVPLVVFVAMVYADSRGEFYHQYIRNQYYWHKEWGICPSLHFKAYLWSRSFLHDDDENLIFPTYSAKDSSRVFQENYATAQLTKLGVSLSVGILEPEGFPFKWKFTQEYVEQDDVTDADMLVGNNITYWIGGLQYGGYSVGRLMKNMMCDIMIYAMCDYRNVSEEFVEHPFLDFLPIFTLH